VFSKSSRVLETKRTQVLAITSITLFTSTLVWFSYSAVQPLVVQDWQLTGFEAGIVFSAFQLGYVAAILPVGPLSDSFSPRWLILVGGAGTGLATLAFGFLATNLITATFLRFVAGVTIAGVYVPGMKLLTDWYPEERRGRAIGIYVGVFSLSVSASFFGASGIASSLGWRTAMITTSVGAVVTAPLVLFIPQLPVERRTNDSSGFEVDGLGMGILRDRAYLYAVGIYSGHNWELYGAEHWLQSFLVATPAVAATDEPLRTAGMIVAVMIGVGGLSNFVSGWISDHVGRTSTIAVTLGASTILVAVFGFLDSLSLPILATVVVLYGFIVNADSAPASTVITEIADTDEVGKALAVQSFVGYGLSVISPVVFGIAFDTAGYRWAFPTLAVGALLGLVSLGLLRRHRHER
jgi:MFS family permease